MTDKETKAGEWAKGRVLTLRARALSGRCEWAGRLHRQVVGADRRGGQWRRCCVRPLGRAGLRWPGCGTRCPPSCTAGTCGRASSRCPEVVAFRWCCEAGGGDGGSPCGVAAARLVQAVAGESPLLAALRRGVAPEAAAGAGVPCTRARPPGHPHRGARARERRVARGERRAAERAQRRRFARCRSACPRHPEGLRRPAPRRRPGRRHRAAGGGPRPPREERPRRLRRPDYRTQRP